MRSSEIFFYKFPFKPWSIEVDFIAC